MGEKNQRGGGGEPMLGHNFETKHPRLLTRDPMHHQSGAISTLEPTFFRLSKSSNIQQANELVWCVRKKNNHFGEAIYACCSS